MHESRPLSLHLPPKRSEKSVPTLGQHTLLALGMHSPCPAAPTHSLQGAETPEGKLTQGR